VPKLFGPIRERYLSRPGGYTRVLRLEPVKEDQAESAILELVDGPRDMRLAMTAKTLSNKPPTKGFNEVTARNVQKVTQFRENGMETLRALVNRMREFKKNESDWDDRVLAAPRRVYLHEERRVREMHYPDPTGDWKLPNNVTQGKRGVSKGARVTRAKGNLPPANRTDVGILEKRVRRQKLSKPRKDESGTEEAEAALAKLSLES
jgi:large subunit ribosomal protein L17